MTTESERTTAADWIVGGLALAALLSVHSCMDSREQQQIREDIAYRNGLTEGARRQALKQQPPTPKAKQSCTWQDLFRQEESQASTTKQQPVRKTS